MKLLLRAFVMCVAALGVGGAAPVFAQESAGGHTTRVGGQTFGTEGYKITTNADGSRSTARRVRVPAFVANGERDALVMPHHALALAGATGEAGKS